MPSDVLTLSSTDLELELSPSIGGAISRLTLFAGRRSKADIARKSHSASKRSGGRKFSPRSVREPGSGRVVWLSGPHHFARAEHGRRPESPARPRVAESLDRGAIRRRLRHCCRTGTNRANGRGRTRPGRSSGSRNRCCRWRSSAATLRTSRCRAGSASIPISHARRRPGSRPESRMPGRSTSTCFRSTRFPRPAATTSATG